MSAVKPGCFGSPLCHSDAALPCTVCPYAGECGVKAAATAERLRTVYHIQDAVRSTMRRPAWKPKVTTGANARPTSPAPVMRVVEIAPPAPAPEPEPDTGGLPQKARELQVRLAKRGIDLPKAIRKGVNPFEVQPPAFMRVLVGLTLTDGFTRPEACERLITDLQWSRQTAASHVSFAVPLLLASGVCIDNAGRIERRI